MFSNDILNLCSQLYDKITVVKGYLQLKDFRSNVDYSLLILNEVNELESLVNKIVDIVTASKEHK